MTTEFEVSEEAIDAIVSVPTQNLPALPFKAEAVEFSIPELAIQLMEEEFLTLTIAGPDDKKGYEYLHKCRMVTKDQRISVEGARVRMKAPALEYGRKVDETAKGISGRLEKIEDYLMLQEKTYTEERKRLAEQREQAIRIRTEERVKLLREAGFSYNAMSDAWELTAIEKPVIINFEDIKGFSDEEYAPTADLVQSIYDAEQQRIAEEKMKGERSRQRIDQLRAWGFVWNADSEMYLFVDGLGVGQYEVFPENIRDASDEEYAPIAGTAKRVYEAEQARLVEVKRVAEELAEANRQEAQRLQAIADQQAAAQKALDDQRKQLEADRCKMILNNRKPQLEATGFDWNGSRFKLLNSFRLSEIDVIDMTDEQFADLLTDAKAKIKQAADEADQAIKAQQEREAAEKKANKERAKRLKTDKADFAEWLRLHNFSETLVSITQPEVIAINQAFNTEMQAIVDKYKGIIEAL